MGGNLASQLMALGGYWWADKRTGGGRFSAVVYWTYMPLATRYTFILGTAVGQWIVVFIGLRYDAAKR